MHEIDPPSAELVDLVAAWMPTRRWYPLKGLAARVEPERSFALTRGVSIHLLRLTTAATSVVVQVPLVTNPPADRVMSARPEAGTGRDHPVDGSQGMVGVLAGVATVYDGVAHHQFHRALLSACHWDDGHPEELDTSDARLITGEQSNSSIVFPNVRVAGSAGVIVKVLRTISPGPNPDLMVPLALARAGWGGVPAPRAWLTLDEGVDHAIGHVIEPHNVTDRMVDTQEGTLLAVVCDLVPDADDGFELACAMAGRGESFEALAADLGATVAEMHAVLAAALPVGERLDVSWLMADLRRRAAEAIAGVAALRERAGAIEAFHDRVATVLGATGSAEPAHPGDPAVPPGLPRLQTIHGDLHLGQALHSAAGWRVLDFEGEPARPAAERTRPDLALRDVAGVVRSLDYAGHVGGAHDAGWTDRAQTAFVDAYGERAGHAPASQALLAALILDKALYEVAYESRNRPSWVPIPLAAVDRLLT